MPEDIQLIVGADTTPAQAAIAQLGPQAQRQIASGITKGFAQGAASFEINTQSFSRPLGTIRGQLGEFNKSLEASNARVIAFGASAGSFFLLQKAISATVKATIDVERKLVSINSILGTSSSGLKNFGDSLFSIAKSTGSAFDEVASAAEELARQGLGVEETLTRTKDAMILARVSGLGVVASVEALTAALNSFNETGITSTQLVNKLIATDANFAVSSGDLAEAIKRVGSSAADAGVGIDELIGVVTAAQQITARGGAVIGNSFKTIFTRIQRPQVLDSLANIGIKTKEANGELVSSIDILKNLASSYDKLSSSQRSQVAELVGGVYQVNILKAIVKDLSSDYGAYNSALKTSASATDEAISKNEALNKSLSATINETGQNLTKFASDFGKVSIEPALKGILNSFNQFYDAVSGKDSSNFIFKALGEFLTGPALTLGLVAATRLTGQFTRFLGDAVVTVTGLAKEQTRVNQLTAHYTELLSQNPQLLDQIIAGEKSVQQVEQLILSQLDQEIAKRQQIANITGAMARSTSAQGARIDPTGALTRQNPSGKATLPAGITPTFASNVGLYTGGANSPSRAAGAQGGAAVPIASQIQERMGRPTPTPVQAQPRVGTPPVFATPERVSSGLGLGFGLSVAGSALAASENKVLGSIGDISNAAGSAALLTGVNNKYIKGMGFALVGLQGAASAFERFQGPSKELEEKFQKSAQRFQEVSDQLSSYQQSLSTLEQAQKSGTVKTETIVKLQDALSKTLHGLPDELRKKLLSSVSGEQTLETISQIREGEKRKAKQVEVARGLAERAGGLGGDFYTKTERILGAGAKSKALRSVGQQIFTSLDTGKISEKAPIFSGTNLKEQLGKFGASQDLLDQIGSYSKETQEALAEMFNRFTKDSVNRIKTEKAVESVRAPLMTQLRDLQRKEAAAEKARILARENLVEQSLSQRNLFTQASQNQSQLMLTSLRGGLTAGKGLISDKESQRVGSGIEFLSNRQKFSESLSNLFLGGIEKTKAKFGEALGIGKGESAVTPAFDAAAKDFASLVARPNLSLGDLQSGTSKILTGLGKESDVPDIKKILDDVRTEAVKQTQSYQQNVRLQEIQNEIDREILRQTQAKTIGGGIKDFLTPGSMTDKTSDISSAISKFKSPFEKGQGSIELAKLITDYGGVSSGNKDIQKLTDSAIEEYQKNLVKRADAFAEQLRAAGLGGAAAAVKNQNFYGIAQRAVMSEIPGGIENAPPEVKALFSKGAGLGGKQNMEFLAPFVQDVSRSFTEAMNGSAFQTAATDFKQAGINLEAATRALQALEAKASKNISQTYDTASQVFPTSATAPAAKAAGHIPNFASRRFVENNLAASGGYAAGGIRSLGGMTYNAAESVKNIPGFDGPFINPPMFSEAGIAHREKSMAMTGVNPYVAFGHIPNYAIKSKWKLPEKVTKELEMTAKKIQVQEITRQPRGQIKSKWRFPEKAEKELEKVGIRLRTQEMAHQRTQQIAQSKALETAKMPKMAAAPELRSRWLFPSLGAMAPNPNIPTPVRPGYPSAPIAKPFGRTIPAVGKPGYPSVPIVDPFGPAVPALGNPGYPSASIMDPFGPAPKVTPAYPPSVMDLAAQKKLKWKGMPAPPTLSKMDIFGKILGGAGGVLGALSLPSQLKEMTDNKGKSSYERILNAADFASSAGGAAATLGGLAGISAFGATGAAIAAFAAPLALPLAAVGGLVQVAKLDAEIYKTNQALKNLESVTYGKDALSERRQKLRTQTGGMSKFDEASLKYSELRNLIYGGQEGSDLSSALANAADKAAVGDLLGEQGLIDNLNPRQKWFFESLKKARQKVEATRAGAPASPQIPDQINAYATKVQAERSIESLNKSMSGAPLEKQIAEYSKMINGTGFQYMKDELKAARTDKVAEYNAEKIVEDLKIRQAYLSNEYIKKSFNEKDAPGTSKARKDFLSEQILVAQNRVKAPEYFTLDKEGKKMAISEEEYINLLAKGLKSKYSENKALGSIPEFNQAYSREENALRARGVSNPKDLIYAGTSSRITSNTSNLGVFNRIDEPNGPSDAFSAMGRIPNFAAASSERSSDVITSIASLSQEVGSKAREYLGTSDKVISKVGDLAQAFSTGQRIDINQQGEISVNLKLSGDVSVKDSKTMEDELKKIKAEIDKIAEVVGEKAKTAIKGLRGTPAQGAPTPAG